MENIDTSTQHEVKTVKEVFDTTSPFFEQMKIKVFPASSHTPVVGRFKFKESSLTRLMLWAAAANLPAGFFGAEMKRNMYTYGPFPGAAKLDWSRLLLLEPGGRCLESNVRKKPPCPTYSVAGSCAGKIKV